MRIFKCEVDLRIIVVILILKSEDINIKLKDS